MAAQINTNDPAMLTNVLWQTFLPLITNGTIKDIKVPPTHYRLIGDAGMKTLSVRFADIIKAPAVVGIDHRGVRCIYPKQGLHGRQLVSDKDADVSKADKEKAASGKLPRPPNSFILYRQHWHPIIKSKQPNLHNNSISAILGKQWKAESQTVKDEFKALAEQAKEKHLLEHPDYQYRPRKPSEKKRRMTRRKAMALVAASPGPSTTADSVVASYPATQASEAVVGHDSPGNEMEYGIAAPAPAMEITEYGNAVFNFGAEDFNDASFEKVLDDFNNGVMAAMPNLQGIAAPTGTPVLHNELSQDAQNDFNFYSGIAEAAYRRA